MSKTSLIILLIVLSVLLLFLFALNIIKKLQMEHRTKQAVEYKKIIGSWIEKFIDAPETEFEKELDKFVDDAFMKSDAYRDTVDEYLTDHLEQHDRKNEERLITIARRLCFHSDCIAYIKNRNPKISAMGSHRAGLYNFTEAIEDMLKSLDILSSENQFEVLVAFARIGLAEPMLQAFEKIKKSVIINERAAIEILTIFRNGDEKRKLFRTMISGDTDYLVTLFLKAVDSVMAELLVYDIVQVLFSGNKEVRAAAVKSLATLGSEAPESVLIMAMEDDHWEIRALAAKALGPIPTPSASQTLYNALFDRQWWVRQNAANALIKHPDYETYFRRAVESGDKYSLDSIIAALQKSNNPELLEFFVNYRNSKEDK